METGHDAPSSSALNGPPVKRLCTHKSPPGSHFNFEALPAELRISIYEYVAGDDKILIEPGKDGWPFSLSLGNPWPLYNVSQRIRDEYVDVALNAAPVTEIDVFDWDFSPVVAYLDYLTEPEIKAFATINRPTGRRFVIRLNVASDNWHNSAGLSKWLARFHDKDAKGSDIDIEYEDTSTARFFTHWGLFFDLHSFIRNITSSRVALEAMMIADCADRRHCSLLAGKSRRAFLARSMS